MTSRLASVLIVGLACLPAARADDPPQAPKAPPYVLKHRSAFKAISDEERAPFSPIGWVKSKAVAADSDGARVVPLPRIALDEKSFKVSSILLGNPSLAIINGRTYSEGEFLRMGRPAPVATAAAGIQPGLRVQVFRISDGAVVLRNQDQSITVMLRRPELSQHNGVEELLLEDRP